jgi:hypothetical protein
MASLNGFNAAEVEPSKGFDPLPVGKYLAAIVDSDMKTTSAGTGEYLKLTFEVMDGEFKGRKLFANLNLDNPSDEAVGIARAELSAICRAVGVLAPQDSVELHNVPVVLKVGHEKRKDTGEIQNRIKGFESRDGVATAAKPASNTPGAVPPWKQKAG